MKTKRILITAFAVVFIAANAHAGRWLSRDPIEEHMDLDPGGQVQMAGPNPYAFCSNDSINFVDFNGLWRIAVALPEARIQVGDIVLYDDQNKPIFATVVRGQGKYVNKKQGLSAPWYQKDGDTPTGEYSGKLDATQQDAGVYGTAPYIRLASGLSGNALEALTKYNRSGLLIHAGRESWQKEGEAEVITGWKTVKKDGQITYEPIREKKKIIIPGNTLGCLRLTQSDLDKLTKEIKCLIQKGEAEVGKVQITGPQAEAPAK